MKCKICGNIYQVRGMGSHITKKHKITTKEYYDLYMKKPGEGKCLICGKDTNIHRLAGYSKYCNYCGKLVGLNAIFNKYGGSPSKNEEVKNKIKHTNLVKYGTENIFASDYGKNKIKATCKQRYNVEYISQSEEFKAKIDYSIAGKKAADTSLQNTMDYANDNNLILLKEWSENPIGFRRWDESEDV